MKAIKILSLLICLLPLLANCQELTLDQLISLTTKNTGETNSYLLSRNWTFHGKVKIDSTQVDLVWGSFLNSDEKEQANAWYSLSFKNDSVVYFNYQFNNKLIYDKILKSIKKMGLQEGKTYVLKDNKIATMYIGNKFLYMLCNNTNLTDKLPFELSITFRNLFDFN